MNLYGMEVFVNANAVVRVSGKPKARKPWMRRGCYYARQVKKLAKAHGPLVYKPAYYKMQDPRTGRDVIVMHPEVFKQTQESMDKRYG